MFTQFLYHLKWLTKIFTIISRPIQPDVLQGLPHYSRSSKAALHSQNQTNTGLDGPLYVVSLPDI